MYTLEDSFVEELTTTEGLAQRVRLSIDHGRQPGLRLIDIEVIGSTVVLSGKVATFHQKQLASALAGRVAGVVELMNQLEVHDDGKDDKLQQPIGLYRQRRAAQRAERSPS
jgi:osmotically-inducible protein OsmY